MPPPSGCTGALASGSWAIFTRWASNSGVGWIWFSWNAPFEARYLAKTAEKNGTAAHLRETAREASFARIAVLISWRRGKSYTDRNRRCRGRAARRRTRGISYRDSLRSGRQCRGPRGGAQDIRGQGASGGPSRHRAL